MTTISLDGVYKHYHLYQNNFQRFREIMTGRSQGKLIKALDPISLELKSGQVLGIIGGNGAGKSTLLKLIAQTSPPSGGNIQINGRVAALLELGTGFHPELTGHENIYLYSSILGIKKQTMDGLYDEVVEFSGIGNFIHQPVKTYSSGMFVRLAFSVATCIQPDILIIDEALSVGDGQFARKSFDRIMQFKDAGKTILFCSHSMFHIESICDRAIWLEKGQVKADASPDIVVNAYNMDIKAKTSALPELHKHTPAPMLDEEYHMVEHRPEDALKNEDANNSTEQDPGIKGKLASFEKIKVSVAGVEGKKLTLINNQSNLFINVSYRSDDSIDVAQLAIAIHDENDHVITSVCTLMDNFELQRDNLGYTKVKLQYPQISLLKGRYYLGVYLMCERCILVYDEAIRCVELNVQQSGRELGVVSLPHHWS